MSIHKVAELHNAKGHNKFRNSKPGFLPDDFMQMRLNFMLEELIEIARACGYEWSIGNDHDFDTNATAGLKFSKDSTIETNLEDAIDGFQDLKYVIYGTEDLMGLKNPVYSEHNKSISEIAFDRVHEANMKKEPVVSNKESTRGFHIDLKKPEGWVKPQFKDLLV